MRVIKWVADQLAELIQKELIDKRADPKYLIDVSGFKAVSLGDSAFTKEKTDSATAFVDSLKKAVPEDSKVGTEAATINRLLDLVKSEKSKIESVEKNAKASAGVLGYFTNYESGTYDGLLTVCSQVLEDLNNLIKEIPRIVHYTPFEITIQAKDISLKSAKNELFWCLTKEFIKMRMDFHRSTATKSKLDAAYVRLYNNEQIIQVCAAIKSALMAFEPDFPVKLKHIALIINGVLLAIAQCNHNDFSRELGVLSVFLETQKRILSNPSGHGYTVLAVDFEEKSIAEGKAIGAADRARTAAATAANTATGVASTLNANGAGNIDVGPSPKPIANADGNGTTTVTAAAAPAAAASSTPAKSAATCGADGKSHAEALGQQVGDLQRKLATNATLGGAAQPSSQPPLLPSNGMNTATNVAVAGATTVVVAAAANSASVGAVVNGAEDGPAAKEKKKKKSAKK